MTEKLLENFLQQVKPDQAIWALCEPSSEDWVVLDSIHFEKLIINHLRKTFQIIIF